MLPTIAIGDRWDASSPPRGAGRLLCVAAEIDVPPGGRLYHKVPIVDMRPIPAVQLAEAVAWLRDTAPERPALVYCNAGVGRSSSVVITYLCLVCRMGFGQAVEFVAARRPNMSILPLLITRIEEARALPRYGVIRRKC